MLFDTYDLPFDAQTAHLLFGLTLGLAFGVAAQISRFCLRRGLVAGPDRRAALGTWLSALVMAIAGTQAATFLGWVDLTDHRLMASELPVAAIAVGGLAFGTGMVLTRGCVSRLTVLSGSGNLRAAMVLLVFALVAHATLKGVLAPLRTSLGDVTVDTGAGALPMLAGAAIALAVAAIVVWLRPRPLHAALAGIIGLLAALGWVGTGWLLLDEFDALPTQSLAFTSAWADSLFWTVASTSIPAGFGVGLVGGVIGGAFLSAAARRELELQSFTSAPETLRYVTGGALMGFGGVLAGGCTVGAGISGTAMLSIAAFVALAAIALGALLTDRAISTSGALQPAE